MRKLTATGKARWPNLPCWEECKPPQTGEPWELDGTGLTFVEPSGMVTLAVKAMQTGTQPKRLTLAPAVESYAQRMGLHKLLRWPESSYMRHHPPGDRFTELQIIKPSMPPKEGSDLCSRIAKVMGQGDRRVEDLFAYILGELTANVRQHAGRPGVVMAQSYIEDHTVEFAIGDWGIGIKAGLSENPAFHGLDDREALELAIRPNTSGKDWAGAPGYGTRENSGNGLFTLSFLAREGQGRFLLASGTWALFISGPRTHYKTLQCSFPGTLVSLRFSPGGMDLGSLLHEATKVRGLANRQDDLHFE
jgi:hypothetical protein